MWIFMFCFWVDLQCDVVAFPDHTHLLYFSASHQLIISFVCACLSVL